MHDLTKFSLRLLALWLGMAAGMNGEATSRLSSRFLARGEQAVLEVSAVGRQPVTMSMPEVPAVRNVTIRPAGYGQKLRRLPGNRLEYGFEYNINSYEVGKYVIPPISVTVDGVKTLTEPLEFEIFDPDDLEWSEVQLGEHTIRYASAFFCMKPRLYVGEAVPVEIKVFIPEELAASVEDRGIPEFERSGVASWRFEPSQTIGQINLLGRRHVTYAYPSTMSATKTGTVAIGPAKVRLTAAGVITSPYLQRRYLEADLQIPKLELESVPLPEGAPAGFENAVGKFTVTATTARLDVTEGEPLVVDVIVSGSGNLDTLRPPKLVDETGWKTYEATAAQRGDERRQLSGTVAFRQLMRPLDLQTVIPQFRLVFFDPEDETYKVVTSQPISLNVQPAALPKGNPSGVPQALPMPIERMTDILAILRPAQLTLPAASAMPWWLGHAVAALIALGLVAKAVWMRIAPRLHSNPQHEARLKELQEISNQPTDDSVAFLRSAGGYIERWLGEKQSPELRAILDERDAVCFRSDEPKTPVNRQRRDEILQILRKASLLWIVVAGLGLSAAPARAADVGTQAIEAYDSAKYEEAIRLWLSAGDYKTLSADTLYNIGNACYRMGSPGQAALYFRRALARNPSHKESLQNLRFIERKYGSITVQRPDFQYVLAKISLPVWKGTLWAGAWLILLGLLTFPATRPGARVRIAAACGLVLGPLLVSAGALGWRYFPGDSRFAAVDRQAVIVQDKVVLYSDAARTAPEVSDAPPGSLCEIIKITGRWAYVSFASETRGWVPIETFEKVIPKSSPAPPKLRKPKADGSSA